MILRAKKVHLYTSGKYVSSAITNILCYASVMQCGNVIAIAAATTFFHSYCHCHC